MICGVSGTEHVKATPFITTAKAVILVCFAVFVVLPLLVACVWAVQDWRYTRFCWRGQQYYARVAEACDQLLAAPESMPRKLKGEELKALPPVFRELNTSYVMVDTNLVVVTMGSGLLSHLIIWKPAADGSSWNLIKSTPEAGKSRVIYSKTKRTSANPPSSVDTPIASLLAFLRQGRSATDRHR